MGTVDRLLKRMGLKRIKGAHYTGASTARTMIDWITKTTSADEAIKGDFRRLRDRSRDLKRNEPIIRQYLSLLRSNVIGPMGIKVQAQARTLTGDLNKPFNDKIEAAWADWAKHPTVDGKLSLLAVQGLLLDTVASDGEAFVRIVRGYKNSHGIAMQLLDPDLIDDSINQAAGTNTNEIRMGVEVDTWGRPLFYHGWTRPLSDNSGYPREKLKIPAADIIHLYHPDRINQTRGVTWFASVMQALRHRGGYIEAELVAARTAAAKMGFFVRTDPSTFTAPDPAAGPTQLEATPGSLEELDPGLQFQAWDPQHPTSAFPDFIKSIDRYIASGLGVSYNALANDLEGVNYSSMRSGLLIERDVWRMLQRWWIDSFLQPVYTEWLKSALLAGSLRLNTRAPEAFLSPKWQPRGWTWVDPLKDVQATIEQIKYGLGSRTDALAEQGIDYEDTLEKLSAEHELAEQYEVAITPEAPAPAGQEPTQTKEPNQ